eukprot:TRINITY_DN4463_c2_g1_i1.p1 TRINITY_DN4463_c2_g1~~TRINITY_DN4463_c2_g1_i1.p1  ORF type:complete len:612 (+),score=106.01 TRINITY_DN4463_c2_g1_i1:86-1921(+)
MGIGLKKWDLKKKERKEKKKKETHTSSKKEMASRSQSNGRRSSSQPGSLRRVAGGSLSSPSLHAREPNVTALDKGTTGTSGSAGRVVLAFMIGCFGTFMLTNLMKEDEMQLTFKRMKDRSSTASNRPTSQQPEVIEVLNLLVALDLEEYSPLIVKNKLTLRELSGKDPGNPESIPGMKPFHMRRLVTESKKRAGSTLNNSPGVEGSDDREMEDVPNPPLTNAAAATTAITPQPAAATVSTAKPRMPGGRVPPLTRPTLVPIPKPSPTPPPTYAPSVKDTKICESLERSKALRTQWNRVTHHSPVKVNGTLNEIPACVDTVVASAAKTSPLQDTDWTTEKHPVLKPAGEGRYATQQLTLLKVKELRRKGVVEQMYIDHDLKFVYCVIPKAGCTTYKAWVLNNAGLFKGGNVHNRELYNKKRIQNGQYVTDEEMLEILNGGKYFKFSITRNPYTRVLATYLERYHQCEKQVRRTKNECDMWKRALINRQTASNHNLPRDNNTFTEYLQIMKDNPTQEVDFRNAHWVSGVQVCGLDELIYDWLGYLENSNDQELLYTITGRKAVPKEKQGGLRHSEGTAKKLSHYTERAKQLVDEIYRNTDISRLGYSPVPGMP